ncbi:LLM class flavin-dependent oxidoreductase [Parasphingopyxis algicola]|uniref:LLM class flavin-dependent oxidoreductase n=1 Tax=Parasphingopyxis algicola TaxID=2026624 RepID=UPI001FE37B14|nr:LLM class flavin-dependent oxidoreductase [Parasphingopyxis algicola]QLC26163.1 LLM class flavin-dependent oxidoreductase [Parasphingopyxis algicola]
MRDMPEYRLSVLDQSPIAEGRTAADAIADTIDLARHADALGYHRYWVAEHHASPALAGATPEALIGPIAQATTRIRVGSGGIMLPHYSPFKVAETFALLSALAPGRIDLGLGRAPGGDGRIMLALQRDRSRRMPHDDFPNNLAELLAYFDGTLPEDHPFAPLADTLPSGGGTPDIWLLGSSMDSALWAAEAGLPYCFADFINPEGAAMTAEYRARFKPSARLAQPHTMVASWVIAAENAETAARLGKPAAMLGALLRRNVLIPVPAIETAEEWLDNNPAALSTRKRRVIHGTPAECRTALDDVAREYGADEMMLVNIMADHEARRDSYRLVAEEYGLASRAKAA